MAQMAVAAHHFGHIAEFGHVAELAPIVFSRIPHVQQHPRPMLTIWWQETKTKRAIIRCESPSRALSSTAITSEGANRECRLFNSSVTN